MFHIDNCYHVPHMDVVGRVCRTHHVSHTAFRGFGGPQGMLVIEEIVDRVARALDLPPHVVRERNFYREGDTTHYGQVVRASGAHRADLVRAAGVSAVVRGALGRGRRLQRAPAGTSSAAWRSRR